MQRRIIQMVKMYFKLSLVVHMFLQQAVAENRWLCNTPTRERGECVPIVACPPLMKALANPQSEAIDDLREYSCSGIYPHVVCCGLSPNFTVPQRTRSIPNKPPVINLPQCGIERRCSLEAGQKLPWLTQIITDSKSLPLPSHVTGVLISSRYVLSYMPSIVVLYSNIAKLLKMTALLGDFGDLTANGTAYQYIGVETVMTHPFHSASAGLNALTLLRLEKDVTFSDSIRPICLLTPGNSMPILQHLLIYGWDETGAIVKTDNAVVVPLEDCQNFWRPKTNALITDYNICTHTGCQNSTQSPCFESGTPAMYYHRSRWYLAGMVGSVGRDDTCEDRIQFVVHTKAAEYFDWIQENLKP